MKRLILATTIAAGMSLGSGQASALVAQPDPFSSYKPVADNTLDDLRGGFSFGGFNFNFGLRIKSVINNALEMVTELTMDRPGRWNNSRTKVRVLDETRAAELTGGNSGGKSSKSPSQQAAKNATKNTGGGSTGSSSSTSNQASQTNSTSSSSSSSTPSNHTANAGSTTSLPDPIPDPTPTSSTSSKQSSNSSTSNSGTTTSQPKTPVKSAPKSTSPAKVNDGGSIEVAVGSSNSVQAVHQVTRDHVLQLLTARGSNLNIEATTEFNINVLDFKNVVRDHMSGIRASRIIDSGRF